MLNLFSFWLLEKCGARPIR